MAVEFAMEHCVAVGADGDEVCRRVYFVRGASGVGDEADVVNVDEVLANGAVCLFKIESAYLTCVAITG